MRIGEQLDGDAGALALPAAQRADPDVGEILGISGARVAQIERGR